MKTLQITECTVKVIKHPRAGDPLLAFANIVIEGQLAVKSLRVIAGKFGPFISWPREFKRGEEQAHNVVFPMTKALQDAASERILKDYAEATGVAPRAQAPTGGAQG